MRSIGISLAIFCLATAAVPAQEPGKPPTLKLWQPPDKNLARQMIAKGEVVAITSRSDQGYMLGNLPAGSVIYLQYVQGKWKGWGNIPTDCPDDPTAEGGDRSRLAIAEVLHSGKQHVEAVVPPNTKTDPYFFVTRHDMPKAVLRINDNDGVFAKNPDGGVKYRLYVQRR